jgi:hypothetical protein
MLGKCWVPQAPLDLKKWSGCRPSAVYRSEERWLAVACFNKLTDWFRRLATPASQKIFPVRDSSHIAGQDGVSLTKISCRRTPRLGDNGMDERDLPSGQPSAVLSRISRPDPNGLAVHRLVCLGRLHSNTLRTRQPNPRGPRREFATNRPDPGTVDNWPKQIRCPAHKGS